MFRRRSGVNDTQANQPVKTDSACSTALGPLCRIGMDLLRGVSYLADQLLQHVLQGYHPDE